MAVVKAVLFAWGLLIRFFNFVGNTVSLLGQILGVVGLLVLAAFIVAAIIDALDPLVNRLRKQRKITDAISRSMLPKVQTFRGNPGVNPLDEWLASEVLGSRFLDIFGIRPGETAFYRQEADYALFRAKELPRTLLGPFRVVVEQNVFTPIFESYRAGDEKTVKWINDAIVAVKTRHPLRMVGRVLRVVTFKFGFKSGEGFGRESVENRGTDRSFIFNEILWLQFWPNASLLCGWVTMDFGIERLMLPASVQPRVMPEPTPARELPLLPAYTGASDVIDMEVEPLEDEERIEEEINGRSDRNELVEEAVASVRFVSDRWQQDSPLFDDPADVLREDEEILLASKPYHPDEELVFAELALNHIRRERLKTFETDFDFEMQRESSGDAPFEASWLSAAVSELGSDIEPKRFRRLSLRHYLTHVAPTDEEDSKKTVCDHVCDDDVVVAIVSPHTEPHQSADARSKQGDRAEVLPAMFVPEGL
ncbi:hypothetical protein EH220_04695 [bacterium]|nr:MAG: hypothetical protein EH220_04695 [bacterium]